LRLRPILIGARRLEFSAQRFKLAHRVKALGFQGVSKGLKLLQFRR